MYRTVYHNYSTSASSVQQRCRLFEGCADAEAVTLTSLMTESYVSVTCHFITSDFRLESCLLQCNKFTECHIAENLVRDLLAVVCEWSTDNEVQAVVTDSTAYIAQQLTSLDLLTCSAVPMY